MMDRLFARGVSPLVLETGGTPHHDHVVQFYDATEALIEKAGAFLAGGLLRGAPAIVIALEERNEAFRVRLASMGVDVGHAMTLGQVSFLDARATLDRFMVADLPDDRLFREVVGKLVAGTVEIWRPARLHAYGEMVDLLWQDGNSPAALRLERLWNDLANRHGFALHCAYAASHFHREEHRAGFNAVCGQHGRIVPTDDLSGELQVQPV